MRLAIIGSGNVGRALGATWQRKGHDVRYGVRDRRSPNAQAVETAGDDRVTGIAEAAAGADVLVLATPFSGAQEAVHACGDVRGKVLIDCTNPLNADYTDLTLGPTTSAAEQIAHWTPGARVVKAFNSLGAQHLGDPRIGAQNASMFLCGDDPAAKQTVLALGRDLGFDMVDAGPLRQARLLESLALLWISLAYAQGNGPDIAFRLLRAS